MVHIKFVALDTDYQDVRRSGQPAEHWWLMLYETGHVRTVKAEAAQLSGLVRSIERLIVSLDDLELA